jgi:uroporphyrinogen decarboxylase
MELVMNSRQRVLAAVARREPDRLPIDLGGTESSGLTALAWHRLVRHLGMEIDDGPRIVDPYQQVGAVEEPLRRRLGIDTVGLFIEPAEWVVGTLSDGSPCRNPARWRPAELPNGDRVVTDAAGRPMARMPRGGFYFDPVGFPLADCRTVGDLEARRDAIESYDLPAYWDEPPEATADRARRLHEGTDAAVVFNFCCHLLHGGTLLRGFEQFMIDLLADRPMAEALLEMLLEAYLRRTDRYAPLLRGAVDLVLFNDDLGTQSGPLISPEVYGELIQPRQARLFQHAREAFDAPILFHTCGAVSAFIPGLIEAGVDAINPVQVTAADMDTATLKRRFGDEVCFWGGGCDTQHVLPRGTPDEVRREVRRRIEDLSPGGGMVFCQVHNIQPDVPPENILTMLEAARQFGR